MGAITSQALLNLLSLSLEALVAHEDVFLWYAETSELFVEVAVAVLEYEYMRVQEYWVVVRIDVAVPLTEALGHAGSALGAELAIEHERDSILACELMVVNVGPENAKNLLQSVCVVRAKDVAAFVFVSIATVEKENLFERNQWIFGEAFR